MTKELSKKLEYVLQQLFKKRDTEPFREPVDYIGLGLTDYPAIIKRMMDLGTIRKNLKVEAYKYLEEALDDIQLVWDNCKLYNIEDSPIHKMAIKLEKITETLLKEQLGELAEANKSLMPKKTSSLNTSVAEKQEEFFYQYSLRRKSHLQQPGPRTHASSVGRTHSPTERNRAELRS